MGLHRCASIRIVCLLGWLAATAHSVSAQSYREAVVDLDTWRHAAIAPAIDRLLTMEEGEDRGEWPYEGVYRVRGRIPIGYRVGGTAIVAMAMLRAPQYETDDRRHGAINRATAFITSSIDHPQMQHAVQSSYDVRGWGYAYGLLFLAELQRAEQVPAGMKEVVAKTIEFFIQGIVTTEIPERHGWNYARRGGFDQPGDPSPFMTASTLQALFAADALDGVSVDAALIERGLAALEASRSAAGSYAYAGKPSSRRSTTPGATGRMLIAEATLHMAGRSSTDRVRGALDAFLAHWSWLDQRRAQTGTHAAPFGIAPYYFYYAHYYAAQCIELLPESQRTEYRRRLHELLKQVQVDDSPTWNDRVFERSASYGTAMAAMALMMPETDLGPLRYEAREEDAD